MDGKISNPAQVCCLRRYELTEGKERGLKVIDCDNGRIRFLLNESKALDMMQLYDRGVNLSFISKNGFTARELPFAKRFEGGMLYTVGLDSAGAREGYPLHGTFHNIPARVVEAACDEGGIRVAAEIEDTELFGKNLIMRRTVECKAGSGCVTVTDVLENRGTRAEDYCLLYHVNLGYPLLGEGAYLIDDGEAEPRTAWAARHIESRKEMGAPAPDQEEMCYFLQLQTPRVSLVNKNLGRKFTLSWSGDTLPQFVEWKSMASGDYALGLEPSTTKLDGGFAYCKLPAGERRRFCIALHCEDM